MVNQKLTHFHGCQLATSNSMKQHKLRKLIAWLSEKEGRDREFVSLYIPGEKSVAEVVERLKVESDSVVAKSERGKGRLQDAFKRAIQHLKLLKGVPQSGLALFAGTFVGNDSEGEVLSVEEVVPPEPIAAFLCDIGDHFQLQPLRDMLRKQKVVGALVVDAKEANFGVQIGECLELAAGISSGIPGKSGKGGQSQRRYERERDMELTQYFHRVADHAAKAFLEDHKVTALLVGGPGLTKEDFVNGDFLHYELKNLLLDLVDTQSAGREAVSEVLAKASEVLKNMCAPEEKLIMQRLLTDIGKQGGLAVWGLDPVLNALRNGEVEVAMVTDSTDVVEIVVTCKSCAFSRMKIARKEEKVQAVQEMTAKRCEKCNAVECRVEERDIVDVLEDMATPTGARVEVISTASEEKAKLAALGGFAALLRYRPTKVD